MAVPYYYSTVNVVTPRQKVCQLQDHQVKIDKKPK